MGKLNIPLYNIDVHEYVTELASSNISSEDCTNHTLKFLAHFRRYVIRLVAFPSQKQSAKAAKNANPAKRSRTEKTIDIDSWVSNKDDPEHKNARDTVK